MLRQSLRCRQGKLVALVFGALLSCLTFNQAVLAEYNIDRWTTEQGLPQNSVTALAQTHDGYIWLGTFGGLVRFDGVKFTVFNTVNAPELKSQRITALYEDRTGTLWIGTEIGEISFYRDGKFSAFDNFEGKAGSIIFSFLADSKGFLWVGGEEELRRYALGADGFTAKERVNLPEYDKGFSAQVQTICEDSTGAVWLGSHIISEDSVSLHRYFEGEFRKFTVADGLPFRLENGKRRVYHADLNVDRNGTLRIATADGVARFDGSRFVTELHDKQTTDNRSRLTVNRNGDLWVNTSDGVARFVENRWVKYSVAAMSATPMRSFLADIEGNLWLGTNGQGLCRLRRRSVEPFDKNRGINAAAAILEDKEGNLWATGDGLRHYENGNFVPIPEVSSRYTTSLAQTRDGTLWIGSFNALYSRRDGVFTDRTAELRSALGKPDFVVKAIFEDSRGALWLGLLDGVVRRQPDGKYEFFTKENGLVENTVHFILETRDGAMWFGTLGGVSRFENARFNNLTTAEGLANNVRAIHEDQDGVIWFGTYGGGLTRLKDGQLKTITMHDGLFDDVISRIIPDEQDNFWMLGNRGIFVASRDELNDLADGKIRLINCRSYGVADGMLTAEGNGGNQPAGWRTRDGRFWFPTINGFVAITPSPPNVFLPPAMIEEASLDGQPLDIREPLEIKPGQQNLEIRYTGLSFTKPELLRFRYKLAGLDDNWVEAGTRRTAYFSYLPPGDYTFTVLAANADGVWNTEGKSIKVHVLPPFYRTWWFIALSALGITALTYSLYRVRISRLEREKSRQQDFSRRLIELQEAERKRIAGELHDSLSQNLVIIKNRAMISLQQRAETEQAFEQMEEIAEAASMSLSEVREIAHNLRPFQIDRLGLTKAIEALVRKANTPDLKVTAKLDDIDSLLPPEMEINLYRIIQESLNNIIKHANATRASIKIIKSDAGIEVTIKDNGKGFDASAIRLGESTNGSGFGLIGITERARILGCVPIIESERGKGTKIGLKLTVNL